MFWTGRRPNDKHAQLSTQKCIHERVKGSMHLQLLDSYLIRFIDGYPIIRYDLTYPSVPRQKRWDGSNCLTYIMYPATNLQVRFNHNLPNYLDLLADLHVEVLTLQVLHPPILLCPKAYPSYKLVSQSQM